MSKGMATKQPVVTYRPPATLLEQVDEARGDVPRNTWITRALEAILQQQKGQKQ